MNAAFIMRLQKHVERLAAQHEINLDTSWAKGVNQAHVSRARDRVHIPPITTLIRYAVALHEIGHVLGRYQDHYNEVVTERWAWEWARRNAIWWTPEMERFAEQALRGYQREHEHRRIIWKVRPSQLARSRERG